jgi:hypothetical protein
VNCNIVHTFCMPGSWELIYILPSYCVFLMVRLHDSVFNYCNRHVYISWLLTICDGVCGQGRRALSCYNMV